MCDWPYIWRRSNFSNLIYYRRTKAQENKLLRSKSFCLKKRKKAYLLFSQFLFLFVTTIQVTSSIQTYLKTSCHLQLKVFQTSTSFGFGFTQSNVGCVCGPSGKIPPSFILFLSSVNLGCLTLYHINSYLYLNVCWHINSYLYLNILI